MAGEKDATAMQRSSEGVSSVGGCGRWVGESGGSGGCATRRWVSQSGDDVSAAGGL